MSLTAYEEKQVQAIADWKAVRPSVLESTLGRLTGTVFNRIGSIVPHTQVGPLLIKAFELAERVDTKTEIKKLSGVEQIEDIRFKTLEFCDGLTENIQKKAESVGLTEAIISESGGMATELLNMPFQAREVILFLKRFAHCYGYTLEDSKSDAYLKTLIILAHETDVTKRLDLLHRLKGLEENRISDEELEKENHEIEKEVGAGFVEGSLMEFVPYLGTLISVYNDYEYFHHLSITAKHVFQERHLRDQGKILEIPPAAVGKREKTIVNSYYFARELVYLTGYGVGYGTGFVGYGLGQIVKILVPPVGRGAVDGGQQAELDAKSASDRVKGGFIKPEKLESPAPIPATA